MISTQKIKQIEYTPEPIDEYIVTVKLLEDWDIVHNYIINENEIDNCLLYTSDAADE